MDFGFPILDFAIVTLPGQQITHAILSQEAVFGLEFGGLLPAVRRQLSMRRGGPERTNLQRSTGGGTPASWLGPLA